jgi:hypothetical protein
VLPPPNCCLGKAFIESKFGKAIGGSNKRAKNNTGWQKGSLPSCLTSFRSRLGFDLVGGANSDNLSATARLLAGDTGDDLMVGDADVSGYGDGSGIGHDT